MYKHAKLAKRLASVDNWLNLTMQITSRTGWTEYGMFLNKKAALSTAEVTMYIKDNSIGFTWRNDTPSQNMSSALHKSTKSMVSHSSKIRAEYGVHEYKVYERHLFWDQSSICHAVTQNDNHQCYISMQSLWETSLPDYTRWQPQVLDRSTKSMRGNSSGIRAAYGAPLYGYILIIVCQHVNIASLQPHYAARYLRLLKQSKHHRQWSKVNMISKGWAQDRTS